MLLILRLAFCARQSPLSSVVAKVESSGGKKKTMTCVLCLRAKIVGYERKMGVKF